MASSSSWKYASVTGSLLQPAGAGGACEQGDTALAEPLRDALRAGEEEALVEADEAAVRVQVGQLRDLGEEVDEHGEALRQLAEQLLRPRRAARLVGEGVVGALAHGDVVVDVHDRARERVAEEAGHEERGVAEALQVPPARLAVPLERALEDEREGLEARLPGRLRREQPLALEVLGEEVHEVVLGGLLDAELAVGEGVDEEVPEVLLGALPDQDRFAHRAVLRAADGGGRLPASPCDGRPSRKVPTSAQRRKPPE